MLDNTQLDSLDSARGLMIAMVTNPNVPEKLREWADTILLDYPMSWLTENMRVNNTLNKEDDHG